jgi:hypothetical protein
MARPPLGPKLAERGEIEGMAMSVASNQAVLIRALRAELTEFEPMSDVWRELGPDERRALVALARRLLLGQRSYGRFDLAHDARDWRKERAEELSDALIYGAIAEVARSLSVGEETRNEANQNGDGREGERQQVRAQPPIARSLHETSIDLVDAEMAAGIEGER